MEDENTLALISLGNILRGDDGVALRVCDRLAELDTGILSIISRYDLGLFSGALGDCLAKHRGAVIVDAMTSGQLAGNTTVIDLHEVLSTNAKLNLRSCHAISMIDELKFLAMQAELPARLLFFGIEVEGNSWTERLSETLEQKLPELAEKLGQTIRTASYNIQKQQESPSD